jgi:hypothetical protein
MSAQIAIPVPRKAEKKRVKLKICLQGPSGSGKTWGALALAKNIWPDAKICLIDTENESASLYADKFDFDTIPLAPPFSSERYEACMDAVVRGGYDVLIIDSISQQWDGDGGILRRKEELDQRPGANSYTNWARFTPEHTAFIESIKQTPIHIIATMRSKQDYVLTDNDRGKKTPVKVGMAPIQRDGFDYEFSLVFDVQMDHKATVSKSRTGLFEGKVVNLTDKKVAADLREWIDSGKEPDAPKPVAVPAPEKVNPTTNLDSEPEAAISTVMVHFRKVDEPTQTRSKKPMLTGLMASVEGADLWFCFDTTLWPELQTLEQKSRRCAGRWMKKGFVIEKVLAKEKTESLEATPEDALLSGDFFNEATV